MTERERWRPVLGFEDSYQVSDLGRVRSITRQVAGRPGRDGSPSVRTLQGKILSPRIRPDGTRAINLWAGNSYRQLSVKRIVLEAWTGKEQPLGYEPKNIDDDPANNALSNLKWEAVGGMAVLRRIFGT